MGTDGKIKLFDITSLSSLITSKNPNENFVWVEYIEKDNIAVAAVGDDEKIFVKKKLKFFYYLLL